MYPHVYWWCQCGAWVAPKKDTQWIVSLGTSKVNLLPEFLDKWYFLPPPQKKHIHGSKLHHVPTYSQSSAQEFTSLTIRKLPWKIFFSGMILEKKHFPPFGPANKFVLLTNSRQSKTQKKTSAGFSCYLYTPQGTITYISHQTGKGKSSTQKVPNSRRFFCEHS